MNDEQLLYPLTLNLAEIRMRISHSDGFHTLDGTEVYEPHIHNCYEIYVNLSGDVSFLVNNQIYAVHSGSVILTAPGDVHLCIYNQPCVHEHFCLWFECSPDSPLIAFFQKPGFGNYLSFEGKEKKELLLLFKHLTSACKENLEPDRTAAFLQILSNLSHRKGAQEEEELHFLDLPEGMQQVLDYIDTHFVEIENVGEISEHFFMSRATMNRWFRKYIRLSPRELLEAKKLSYAKKLLAQGMNVTDTSMHAGFSDCSYFISVFKKKFGKTPLQYQKQREE